MSRNGKRSWRARFRQRRFLAVDFDSSQLRIAHVAKGPLGPRVRRLVAREIPPPVDITETAEVGGLLARTLKEAGLGHLPVVMNIPRGQAVLKPLRLPPGTADSEIASMVRYQVQSDLPFRAEEAVLDFAVEGDVEEEESAGPAGVDVLAAAVRLPVVDYYRSVAELAGVRLMRLGLRPYANTRCVQVASPGEAETSTVIVHITADETQIDVIEGKRLAFSRSAVVKVRGDDEQTAPDEDDTRAAPAPTSHAERVDAVVAEIIRTLQGYTTVENASRVDRLLVAGGTGLEADVAEMLAQGEATDAAVFNPAESVKVKGVDEVSPFITVIGLAFETGAARPPFDFLHPKEPAPHRDPKRDRLIAAGLAVGILLFISVFAGWFYLNSRQQVVDDLLTRKRHARDRETFVDRLADRVGDVDDWAEENVRWLAHWANLTVLLPAADEAYIDELRASGDEMTFNVHGRDSETIAGFVKALREAG
ncbi:MAG: pilus assembly protein PilM, partial [Phycisphaerae bacterium]|nr:pilus assembly protein PilM [Phycisphaerae bacterium]